MSRCGIYQKHTNYTMEPTGNAKMKNKISGKKEFIRLAEEQTKHKRG